MEVYVVLKFGDRKNKKKPNEEGTKLCLSRFSLMNRIKSLLSC